MKRNHFRNKRLTVPVGQIIKNNKKSFALLIGIIAAVITAVVVIVNAVEDRNYKQSFLVTDDVLTIGIRTGVPGFGELGSDGEITGYDRDYIDEVLRRMLPDSQKRIEYVEITSQSAGASIKYGIANICLGLLTQDTDRTVGFRLTKPYYNDSMVAVVPGVSRLESISNLEGGKLGILSVAVSTDDLDKYLHREGLEYDILRYADYESAMSDLENNRVNAIVLPYALAKRFESAGYRILAEPLYGIGYRIMLPTGQQAFANEMNKVIDEMENDGTADMLRKKWGIG